MRLPIGLISRLRLAPHGCDRFVRITQVPFGGAIGKRLPPTRRRGFMQLLASSLSLGLLAGVMIGAAAADDVPAALAGYSRFEQLQQRLADACRSDWAQLRSLGKTIEGRDVWLVSLSAPDRAPDTQPAILVLGNVHAPHLLGAELATAMVERLVADVDSSEATQKWLSQFTLYVIACPSPDATERNFEMPAREVAGNRRPTDDDRDFEFGEDPPQDLNGDGYITLMRVADPLGTHRPHPDDPRVMITVDKKANEIGSWRLLPEGRDSDGDGQFAEDASDGVDFNRNFTFDYEFFGRQAGPHQVSEAESRAVADFAFAHPNIGVVFCFSPHDNLFEPWKGSSQTDGARIKTRLLTGDAPYTDFIAKQYQKLHGGKQPPIAQAEKGDFLNWSYFHFGRWSFGSRGWWIPPTKVEKPATASTEKADAADSADAASEGSTDASAAAGPAGDPQLPVGDKLPAGDKRGAGDLAALAWMDQAGIEGFSSWQPIEHPDFPGQRVEVGGFRPFYRLNPPSTMIAELVPPQVEFVQWLSGLWPRIELQEVELEPLGGGLYSLQLKIVNTGYLPTMPQMGQVNGQWYPIQVALDLPFAAVQWLEGSPRQATGRLEGLGGSTELRWLFRLETPLEQPVTVDLKAYSPSLHPTQHQIELTP